MLAFGIALEMQSAVLGFVLESDFLRALVFLAEVKVFTVGLMQV